MAIGKAIAKAGKASLKDSYSAYTNPYHGSFSPHITGAVLGTATGAVGGAIMSAAFSGGANGVEGGMIGAGVGAGVGALAVPALGVAGAGISKFFTSNAMEKIGTGIINIGKAAGVGTLAAGYGANTIFSPVVRRGMHRMAHTFAAPLEFGKESLVKGENGLELKRKAISINMGDRTRDKIKNYGKLGIVAGIAGVMLGGNKVGNDLYNERQGNQSIGVRRATPNYMDNAGATGDLVFAMHQNRRG